MCFGKIDLLRPPSRRTAILWQAGGGWVSNVVLIAQGLLLIPLYISYLGETLYGYWLASGGILAWMAMVDIGASAVTKQRCAAAYGRMDLPAVIDYFWHGLVITILIGFAFLGLVLAGGGVVVEWLGPAQDSSEVLKACFQLSGVAGLLSIIGSFLRDFCSALQRNGFAVLGQVTGDVGGLAVTLLSLRAGHGLWAIAIGGIVRFGLPSMICAIYVAAVIRSTPEGRGWSRAIFRDYLLTTPAVLGAKATGSFVGQLPAVLLTKWIGPESSVAYTVTVRALQILEQFSNHITSALYGAAGHFFSDRSVSDDQKRIKTRAMVFVVLGGVAIGAFVYSGANKGFVLLWTAPAQFAGQELTLLSAAAVVSIITVRLYEMLCGSVGAIAGSGYVGTVERAARALVMVPAVLALGVIGVPLATLITCALAYPFYQRVLRRAAPPVAAAAEPLVWGWLPIGALVALGGAGTAWIGAGDWVRWALHSSVLALTGSVLVAGAFLVWCPDALRLLRGVDRR